MKFFTNGYTGSCETSSATSDEKIISKWQHFGFSTWPRDIESEPLNVTFSPLDNFMLPLCFFRWVESWQTRELGPEVGDKWDLFSTYFFNSWMPRNLVRSDTVEYCLISKTCSKLLMSKVGVIEYLVAWWHQAITWTYVDLSIIRSNDIHLRAISVDISKPSVTKMCVKINY